MANTNRSSYIDIMKFMFAICVLLFHLGNGILPGGRAVVEGFFMISGYFMMRYIEKDRAAGTELDVSTARFMGRKLALLLPYLIPSAILSTGVYAIRTGQSLWSLAKLMPLTLFEFFPISIIGFKGIVTLGVSWYMSAMIVGLAMLYPLCRKYGARFTCTVCPLISLMAYGFLSNMYESLAVYTWVDENYIYGGLIRGLAGLAAGAVMYECVKALSAKKLTAAGKTVFAVCEVVGIAMCIWIMQRHPNSRYDYVAMFAQFALLTAGISGLTPLGRLKLRHSKLLGTASTLIVLNHYCWNELFTLKFGEAYRYDSRVWLYFAATAAACVVVWLAAKGIEWFMRAAPGMIFAAGKEEK